MLDCTGRPLALCSPIKMEATKDEKKSMTLGITDCHIFSTVANPFPYFISEQSKPFSPTGDTLMAMAKLSGPEGK